MKLYFSPGACSLSPHIVAQEAGIPLQLVKVDLKNKTYAGGDYTKINPKGAVPALQLDDGQVLTEGPAIVQYLADSKPESRLAPPAGTFERYRLMEWLNYLSSEVHKAYAPLFNPASSEDAKKAAIELLSKKFSYLESQLQDKQFLMGNAFSVADAYLYVLLSWTARVKIDLTKWPALKAYFDRVGARPKVKEAVQAETA